MAGRVLISEKWQSVRRSRRRHLGIPGDQGRGGGDIRRARLWYLVADEGGDRPLYGYRKGGGGLIHGVIRAHWAGSSPGRDQSGSDGGSGSAAYLPEPPRGDGEGTGSTAWRPVLRLFIRTLVVILKNNALFIS